MKLLKSSTGRVFLLIEEKNRPNYAEFVKKYLISNSIQVEMGSDFPKNPSNFDLIVPINYPRVVPTNVHLRNVVVFHTSDLPKGRGWSPIANIFLENKSEYCLSGFIATPEIDSGDLLMKIRFIIRPSDTAQSIRKIDNHLTFIGILLLTRILADDQLFGEIQDEARATYSTRRSKEMNELSLNNTIAEVMPLLRSTEPGHEAYVVFEGVKFEIYVKPMEAPRFPDGIVVELLHSRKNYPLKDLIRKFELEIEIPNKL